MKFSPNGQHLLGGVGDGFVYLDGQIPMTLRGLEAGGWDWLDDVHIVGPGGFNTADAGIYEFDLTTGQTRKVSNALSTAFFAAAGKWVAYLADGKTWSFDYAGREFKPYVAVGIFPNGDYIFTDSSNQQFFAWRNDSMEVLPAKPLELTTFFCDTPDGKRWICDGQNGLVVHEAGKTLGYKLNNTPHDFDQDIAYRTSDGLIVVGTGENAGETAQHLYEIAFDMGWWRKDGGPWQSLQLVDLSASTEPIPVIGRSMLFGFFEFGTPNPPVPCNCRLSIGGTSAYVTALDGTKLLKYLAVSPEGDLTALDALIAATKDATPLPFWTMGAQQERAPKADDVGIQANRLADESVDAFEARIRASCRKVKRAYLLGQCYRSNLDNTADLPSVVRPLARIARDEPNVAGIILFHAGPNRHDGWDLHPEIHADWQQVFAGIPKAPLPKPVTPPVTPKPSMPSATAFKGVHVKVRAKLKGKYIGVDPAVPQSVYANRVTGGGWETLDLEPSKGNPKAFNATFGDAKVVLSLSPDGTLQTRPAGTDGAWEQLQATNQPDGSSLLYRLEGGVLVEPVLQLEAA